MNYEFCKKVRLLELDNITKYLDNNSVVLEIGAGAGWQAKHLSQFVKDIQAIDIADSRYLEKSEWPITLFDGKCIPYDDNTFDVVFSSNVLEHVIKLEELVLETQRVLKPGGISIHILPSTSWRICTSITHYFWLLKNIFVVSSNSANKKNEFIHSTKEHSYFYIAKKALWPERHGNNGNSVTELYFFSKTYWEKYFKQSGWMNISSHPNGLCYSGNSLFGESISIKKRKLLSRIFGSATITYLLK